MQQVNRRSATNQPNALCDNPEPRRVYPLGSSTSLVVRIPPPSRYASPNFFGANFSNNHDEYLAVLFLSTMSLKTLTPIPIPLPLPRAIHHIPRFRIPSRAINRPSTPNKHDHGNTSDDSWYTPYTGTYEPPPSQSHLRPSITYSPPLDAYSEQEQAPYSAAYPHPYSYQIPRRAEPDLDPHPSPLPSLPLLSHSASTETSRYGSGQTSKIASGPSFLSGAGAIGESPVAPHAQVAKTERASHRTFLASFMTFGAR